MNNLAISFEGRVTIPQDVLLSGVEGESVLLNLESERYFGLDEVGTRMFSVLTESNSIQAAYEVLLDEYNVDAKSLRSDLISLINDLVAQGLMEIAGG